MLFREMKIDGDALDFSNSTDDENYLNFFDEDDLKNLS